jgi:aldose 1-epimerase
MMLTLRSQNITAQFHPSGARLVSCVVDGVETVMGNRVDNGMLTGDLYAGVVCGRHAGRITDASFMLDGERVALVPNMGVHQLHGGPDGFATRWWDHMFDGNRLTFSLQSPDGDQGYPGHMWVKAVYDLRGFALSLTITAGTSKPTVCNITNHAYWNLAGGGSVLGHELTIPAQQYFPLNDLLLPLGEMRDVAGGRFDFRKARAIAEDYDNAFLLDGVRGEMKRAMMMCEPGSGRTLDVWTTEGVLQMYTAMHWNGDGTALGPQGALGRSEAFAIEPQNVADAPNHANFPSSILRPGEEYRNHIEWRFN